MLNSFARSLFFFKSPKNSFLFLSDSYHYPVCYMLHGTTTGHADDSLPADHIKSKTRFCHHLMYFINLFHSNLILPKITAVNLLRPFRKYTSSTRPGLSYPSWIIDLCGTILILSKWLRLATLVTDKTQLPII